MNEENIITLNDEDGNEIKFEFLDLISYRQKDYVVMLPLEDSDGQVVILQLEGTMSTLTHKILYQLHCFLYIIGYYTMGHRTGS